MEESYTVAQAVKLTGVKSYVLRYWEEELDLKIGRNEMGHRCYTGYDIQLFLNIKELKKRGLQLRAIKDALPRVVQTKAGSVENMSEGETLLLPEKSCAVEKKNEGKEDAEKIVEFEKILERLITQELHAKNEGEDRWRSLDEAIRRQQQARKEAAAASEKKGKKNSCKANKKEFPV